MTEEKIISRLSDYRVSEDDGEEFETEQTQQISEIHEFSVALEDGGERLDKYLAAMLPELSRTRLKEIIEDGFVKVDGVVVKKPRKAVVLGEVIEVKVVTRIQDMEFQPTEMPLDIVYEDEDILVVNKPADLVVHPAAGHWTDTLLNGLLAYDPIFKSLPRAGIVHRLDKDTTGLMVVAKNEQAQVNLTEQLQQRSVKREYWALTRGKVPEDKIINEPLTRDPKNPLRFTVSHSSRAKEAITHLKLVAYKQVKDKPFSWVALRLKTGRTHQIRAHMEFIGFPLIGDPLYRKNLPKPKEDGTVLNSFSRQALHASRLGLLHPRTGEYMEWFVEPPVDMTDLMDELGFGPWDEPTEVFEGNLIASEAKTEKVNDRIRSWDDFDFGDDDDTDMSVWEINRSGH